jgi:hypothetical protein
MNKYLAYGWAFVVFGVGCFLASYVHRMTRSSELSWNQSRLQEAIDSFVFSLHERYLRNQVMLDGAKGLVLASEYISRQKWQDYLSTLKVAQYFPAVKWVGFVEVVQSSNFSTFVTGVRGKEDPNYRIWPESTRDVLYPILYVEPEGYRGWVGFDLGQDGQGELFANAFKTNKIGVMPAMKLTPTDAETDCFFFFNPLERKDGSKALIVNSIAFSTLVEDVLQGLHFEGMSVTAYFGTN